jgi:hypothetical protein
MPFVMLLTSAWVLIARAPAGAADWQPRGLLPTTATLADVLAANARAAGSGDVRLAQRRERWTYVNGTHRIAVAVAVRDADFRTTLNLDGLEYTAGRLGGARWRGDGNGIVHGIEADLQGDALDRPPQAVFPLDPASCTLAGEARLPQPAWVIAIHTDGDKPAFLYVDESSGAIVREVMRDGKRVVTTRFDRFEPVDGLLRARHWHIDDGNPANDLDVSVDAIEPGNVATADVALPARHGFTAITPLVASAELDAQFERDRIRVAVNVAGTRHWFLLDTGTTSITVDPRLGRQAGGITLEHAALTDVGVGPLHADRLSVLSIPDFDFDGILGLDFFFGHVIEIDYLRRRVRVLTPDDARAAFADPATFVLPANVDQGLPLVPAALGALRTDTFALDTGSAHPYVMRPFMQRYASEIARTWTPAGKTVLENYLEGGIELQPYRVRDFTFGGVDFQTAIVSGQVPTKRTDDLAVPFDGIIGTDVLRNFDVYVDYDNARIGVRTHERR